jgi:PIN domain nuclease of toxin-antitoxin system
VILLDTHVALWFGAGSDLLGRQTRRLARQAAAQSRLVVSAVSFWEIALLIAKRRLRSLDSAGTTRRLILGAGVNELPLGGEIAVLAGELEGLHADPADRFIAATAIVHDATLITADARLLRWRHSVRRQDAKT